ncbi:Hypothetical protein LUCI_2182 [Lucifera butyrica]|uniref:CheW-like domain-containing protein n=1 Tax=Lucifera butyrica TaxID=1351585 RepID=A0A498R7P2_9FIRM|nr:chemotaxis protein CheW [Lucifera butyrica]VBB06940.1 Hypothetical protein LUCI_2182 [Lucifera butyrica]
MAQESLKLVVFTMETDNMVYEYGIPIEQVYEIIRPGKTMKLPGMPSFMEGVTNLRGSIIPVIDLKKRFALGVTAPKDTTRIVVVEINHQKCGIIVDDVLEILLIPTADMEKTPAIAGGISPNYIIGLGKVDDRLVIALSMDNILTEKEETVLASVV